MVFILGENCCMESANWYADSKSLVVGEYSFHLNKSVSFDKIKGPVTFDAIVDRIRDSVLAGKTYVNLEGFVGIDAKNDKEDNAK